MISSGNSARGTFEGTVDRSDVTDGVVLRLHERDSGTFAVNSGHSWDEALNLARAAAGDENVAIAGGATTINQCLAAGVIDELRLHVVPVVLDVG